MEKGYYKASVVDGVYFYGEVLDDPETECLSPELFYDLLPAVGDDEEIVTYMDEESIAIYNAIRDEYGIHNLI